MGRPEGRRSPSTGGAGEGLRAGDGVNPRRPPRHRSGWLRVLPFLIIGLIAFVVLRKEFPSFDARVQKTIDGAAWQATETCIEGAVSGAPVPDFVRVIRRGETKRTRNGYHVRGVLIGEMGDRGQEVKTSVSCYVNAAGEIAGVTRERWVAEPSVLPSGDQ